MADWNGQVAHTGAAAGAGRVHRSMSRRTVISGGVGATAASLLAACTAGQNTAAPAPDTKAPVTLDWFASPNTQGRDETMNSFMEKHPNITINQIPTGRSDVHEEKMFTAVAAGTPPDVTWSHLANLGTFAHKKVVKDLDALAAKKTMDFDLADFFPQALEHFKWQGKLWGIPQEWDPSLYYYSKTAIQRAGLQDPAQLEKNGQWTMSKLEDYLKAISRPNDPAAPMHGTLEVPVDLKIQVPYLWFYGGDAYAKDYKEAVFNTPASLQGWETLIKQRTNGWALPATGMANLRDGKVAFVFLPRRDVGVLRDVKDGAGFGIVSFPADAKGKQVTRASTAAYCVAAGTQRGDASWLFVQHIGTVGNDNAVALQGTGPNRRPALKSEVYLKSLLPWESAAEYERVNGHVRSHVMPPGGVKIIDIAKQAYNKVVKGESAVRPAFDDAKRQADQVLKEMLG